MGSRGYVCCGYIPPVSLISPHGRRQSAPFVKKISGRFPARRARRPGRTLCKAQALASNEPVEDGVTLPKPKDRDELEQQTILLERELTSWLDSEWQQSEHQPVHGEIGQRVGRIYARHRMEGEDDLSSLMIAIGSELEGDDFSQAFVGPWNIANRTAELLLEHCAGERTKWKPSFQIASTKDSEPANEATDTPVERRKQAASPSLADSFERLKFLRDVLDGSASKELVDGAVALTMGYTYVAETGGWNGEQVEDEHFRKFSDYPPDVLGDENEAQLTATLAYLEGQLGLDEDESGQLADGLDAIVEALHGTELTKVQTEDPEDHSFRKRVILAKWLHLVGGF